MSNAGRGGETVSRAEVIERVERSRGKMPEPLLELLNLPKMMVVESGLDYLYFVVPSGEHEEDHDDPYYHLTGTQEDLDWVNYLFGVRREGGRVYLLLVDRERRITVATKCFDIHDESPSFDWARFGRDIRQSLEALQAEEGANHVKTYGGIASVIYDFEDQAWN